MELLHREVPEDVKIMVTATVEDKYVSDPKREVDTDAMLFENYSFKADDKLWRDDGSLEDCKIVEEDDGTISKKAVAQEDGSKLVETKQEETTAAINSDVPIGAATSAAAPAEVKHLEAPAAGKEEAPGREEVAGKEEAPAKEEATGGKEEVPAPLAEPENIEVLSRASVSSESLPLPHSGILPLSGPIIHRSSQSASGPIPYSGNLSLRSDSSTTSTRSFAFPIFTFDNSSPAKMAPPEKKYFRRNRWFCRWFCCCCYCCGSRPARH